MLIITVFLVGQLILGPLGTLTVHAEDASNVVEQTITDSATTDFATHTNEESAEDEELNPDNLQDEPEETPKEEKEGDSLEKDKVPVEENAPVDEEDEDNPLNKAPPVEDNKEDKKDENQDSASENPEANDLQEPGDNSNQEEEKVEGVKDGAFTLKLVELLTSEGKPLPTEGIDPTNKELDFQAHYTWSLKDGHSYKEGDIVTFDLPKQLKIEQQIKGNLDDYGTFVVNTDNKVTFTFTKKVEEESDINGTFWIVSKLNWDEVVIEGEKITIDSLVDGGKITIPVKTEGMEASIDKRVEPNKQFSPTELHWTVTVDSNYTKHTNGVMTDKLPEGLELISGTVKVDGKLVEPNVDGQQFSISLGDFNGQKTITYTTTIKNFEIEKFTNSATYKSDQTEEISTSATAEIKRGEPLTKEKGVYNPQDQTIEWTVNLNFNSKKMDAQTLKDTWSGIPGVTLVNDSIKFYEVKLNDQGKPTNEKTDKTNTLENIAPTENGFSVTIPAIETPHQLKYKTKLPERGEEGKLTNKVEWGNNTQGNTGDIPVQTPKKTLGTVDYNKKEVEWKITHNSNKAPIKNITITDTLQEGLTYVEGSVKVKIGNADVTKPENIKITGQTLEVKIDGEVNDKIEVTFNTTFDYSKLEKGQSFKNKANVTWTDEFNKEQNKDSDEATFEPNNPTQNNGTKSGKYDYTDKEITWTVIVNYQQNAYDNLIVEDKPQGNQKLVEDSIIVEKVTVNTDGTVTSKEKVEKKPEITGNDFKITIGNTNEPYRITYKTTLKEETSIDSEYKNIAEVKNDTDLVANLEATVSVTGGGKYVTKKGNQNGAVIDWEVVVNPQQAKISNVVLTDTISDNQEFLEGSVQVFTTNPGETEGKEQYPNFEKSFSKDKKTLTVKFNNGGEIDRAYVVKYTTLHFAGTGQKVENSYKVTGDSLETTHTTESKETVTVKQMGGGSGSGKVGYLKVKKVANDKPEESNALAGVEFELIDPVSKRVLKTGTTDDDGIIEFGRLKFATYELKELNTPEGYLKPEGNYKVKVDKEYKKDDLATIQIHTITNEKEIKQALIIKYDGSTSVEEAIPLSSNKFLSGAEFKIEFENGETVPGNEKLVTDENGQILTKELEEGKYFLVETKAPEGYQLRTERQPFTIVAGNNAPVEVEFANYPHGSVNLKKVGKDFTNPTDELKSLQGVQFELQKKQAGGTFEKVGETLITDVNGSIAVNDLADGDYRFVEIATIEGYEMLSEEEQAKLTFTIKNGELAKTVAEQVVALFKESSDFTFTVENEVDDETTKLVKHDAKDETKLLKGAQFKVYQKADADAKPNPKTDTAVNNEQVYTTDDNGEIIIKDLPHGHYYYVETKAPSGYRIDRTPVEFEVKKDAYVITKIGNKKRSGGGGGGGTPPPVDPEEPTDPENPDPTDPTDPENPDPTDPTDPENPDPTDPTDPTTPTDPENPDPTDPTDPTTPTDPDENENPEDVTNNPNDPNSPKDPNEGEHGDGVTNNGGKHPNKPNTDGAGKLPQTGEELYVVMMFGGMALVLIGSVLVFRRRVS